MDVPNILETDNFVIEGLCYPGCVHYCVLDGEKTLIDAARIAEICASLEITVPLHFS